MGSSDRTGKGFTPPKGKATSAQGDTDEKPPRVSATVEWVIVGLVLVGVLAVALIFATGGDSQTPHGGAPDPYAVPEVVDQI